MSSRGGSGLARVWARHELVYGIGNRHGCTEGRMNVLLSLPLVRAVSPSLLYYFIGGWDRIVLHTRGMRRFSQRINCWSITSGINQIKFPGQDERKRSKRVIPLLEWVTRQTVGYVWGKLYAGVAIDWVSCRSPSRLSP